MQSVLTKCVVGFEELYSWGFDLAMKSLAPCPPLVAVAGAATGASKPCRMLLFFCSECNNQLKILTLFTIKIEHEFTEIGEHIPKPSQGMGTVAPEPGLTL
jgi:hypothetical protein